MIADVVRLDKGHTEGLEPKVTEALIKLMVSVPGGKARTGKVAISSDSPERHAPVSRSNVFLCSGHATLGVPAASPTIPRASTISRWCGHMFCDAYHRPVAAKWKSASCIEP